MQHDDGYSSILTTMREQTVRLRGAVASDAEIISGLLAELGYPQGGADMASRLAGVLNEGGAVLLAVDDAENPVGLMCLARHVVLHAPGAVAYITALVITNAAHRRGIGRLLVTAAKDWARQQGCVRLTVTSGERRADAHAFYAACGLPYTGRRFSTSITQAR